MNYKKFIILIILVAFIIIFYQFQFGFRQTIIEISITPQIHNDYGLSYPLTYEFRIPAHSFNLGAYKRYLESQNWQQISEKTSNDFFNGIEAVRFDYEKGRAYVSVGFGHQSDKIQIKIADELGKLVKIKYLGITKYYDNRKAAVVVVGDDWGVWKVLGQEEKNQKKVRDSFKKAFQILRDNNIFFTPALTTNRGVLSSDWQDLQKRIEQGYVEVAAHSRTHSSLPYNDYDSEVAGCRKDIVENLDLAYKNGTREYVYAWIRPFGQGDETLRQKLGQNKYLVDRVSCCFIQDEFSAWDKKYGLFKPIGYSVYLEKSNLDEANIRFDTVVGAGGIYSVYMHPYNINWESGSWERQHFDYIKQKNNLWYTGLGHLYLYHFGQIGDFISLKIKNRFPIQFF